MERWPTIEGPEELAAASDACGGRECWLALSDVNSDGIFMWAGDSVELGRDSLLWDWPLSDSEGVDCGYVVGRGRSSRIRLSECASTPRLAVCKAPYARCPVGFERKGNACFRVIEPKTISRSNCSMRGPWRQIGSRPHSCTTASRARYLRPVFNGSFVLGRL